MTCTPCSPTGCPPMPPRHGWRARFILLGPLAVMVLATLLETETDLLAPLWLAAIAWTVLGSLAGALWCSLFRGDRSAFRNCPVPEDGGELEEWAACTGRYEWVGDHEDRLRDHERPC